MNWKKSWSRYFAQWNRNKLIIYNFWCLICWEEIPVNVLKLKKFQLTWSVKITVLVVFATGSHIRAKFQWSSDYVEETLFRGVDLFVRKEFTPNQFYHSNHPKNWDDSILWHFCFGPSHQNLRCFLIFYWSSQILVHLVYCYSLYGKKAEFFLIKILHGAYLSSCFSLILWDHQWPRLVLVMETRTVLKLNSANSIRAWNHLFPNNHPSEFYAIYWWKKCTCEIN